MASNRMRSYLSLSPGLSLPDMGPIASLVFLLVGFYMFSGRFKWPDESVVSESKMAYSTPDYRCHLSDGGGAIIGLGENNQRSFSTSSAVQAATIQAVAQRHGVTFTPSQTARLESLPFLATNVENLPELLSLSAFERSKRIRSQTISPLSEQQLMECITTAKTENATRWHMPLYIYLQVDANAKMKQFEQLTDILQTLGNNRFMLMTLCKRREASTK